MWQYLQICKNRLMYFYEVSDKTAACTIVTQNYISLRTNNFALNTSRWYYFNKCRNQNGKIILTILCPPIMCSNFILQNKVLNFPIILTYLFLVHCISWVHSLHDEWIISCDISPRNIFVWSNHIYRPYLSLLISKTFFFMTRRDGNYLFLSMICF